VPAFAAWHQSSAGSATSPRSSRGILARLGTEAPDTCQDHRGVRSVQRSKKRNGCESSGCILRRVPSGKPNPDTARRVEDVLGIELQRSTDPKVDWVDGGLTRKRAQPICGFSGRRARRRATWISDQRRMPSLPARRPPISRRVLG